LKGANLQTTFLLLAYGAGAATSLAVALFASKAPGWGKSDVYASHECGSSQQGMAGDGWLADDCTQTLAGVEFDCSDAFHRQGL